MKALFRFKVTFLILVMVMLAACDEGEHYAPVTELSTIQPIPQGGFHIAREDESLYSIAWRYGKDYQQLAIINHLSPPYYLHTGQVIRLRSPSQLPTQSLPSSAKQASLSSPTFQEANVALNGWLWPAEGKIVKKYSDMNKGINIKGVLGSSIYASSAGEVVYSGNGLRGYGNLIIIKHSNLYLSAYAFNKKLLVKEGQWVKRGQQIAYMGRASTGEVMLHFEIRRGGAPIDPLSVLGSSV